MWLSKRKYDEMILRMEIINEHNRKISEVFQSIEREVSLEVLRNKEMRKCLHMRTQKNKWCKECKRREECLLSRTCDKKSPEDFIDEILKINI